MLLNGNVMVLFSSVGCLGTENEYISREQPTGSSGWIAYFTLQGILEESWMRQIVGKYQCILLDHFYPLTDQYMLWLCDSHRL